MRGKRRSNGGEWEKNERERGEKKSAGTEKDGGGQSRRRRRAFGARRSTAAVTAPNHPSSHSCSFALWNFHTRFGPAITLR